MAAAAPSSDEASADERPTRSRASLLLEKIFRSCDEDPKGSVHKAWGLSLIFVFVYFIISVVESKFSHCHLLDSHDDCNPFTLFFHLYFAYLILF